MARAAPPKTSLRASLGLGLGLGLSLAVGLGLGLDVVARLDEATEPLEALPALAELHVTEEESARPRGSSGPGARRAARTACAAHRAARRARRARRARTARTAALGGRHSGGRREARRDVPQHWRPRELDGARATAM